MRKNKLLLLLVLLMTAATGAWAQDWTDIIVNGNLEGTDRQCFFVKENHLGSENVYYASIKEGSGKDGSRGIMLQSTGEEANSWDTQFYLRLPYELPAGTKYRLKFDYKADNACKCDLQAQNEPGEYIIWYIDNAQGSPACNFGTDWATYDSGEITVPADCNGKENEGGFLNNFQTIAFNLSQNQKATTYYIDNIKLEILTSVASGLTESPAPKALPQYPVEITKMAIMGDFLGKGDDGNWNTANAWALTQDATNNKVWTLTKEFTAEAKTYDYKLFANDNMSDFTYPVEEKAKGQFVVSKAGQYNLKITASLEYNVVSVYAVPVSLSVTMKAGTKDAEKWTITSGQKSTTGDVAEGLTGLVLGDPVTLNYSGRLKVKSVTATVADNSVLIPVAGIALNKKSTDIEAGQTETLSLATVLPDYATDKSVTWTSSDEAVATVDQTGKVTAVAMGNAVITATANDGSGVKAECAVTVYSLHIDLSTLTGDVIVRDGAELTGTLPNTANVKIAIAPNATVTLNGANINGDDFFPENSWKAGLHCNGDATIILAEGTTNTVRGSKTSAPGLSVSDGYTMTIQGNGTLNAYGGKNAPGIGGWAWGGGGSLVIAGGTINAYGTGLAAGIGTGASGSWGDITITGGTVTATGGTDEDGGAGIGTGNNGTCGNINITGGSVTANGNGRSGTGIGGSFFSKCGNITITDGVTMVKATRTNTRTVTIGLGYSESTRTSTCGTVTIGGTQYYDGAAYQNSGAEYLAKNPFVYPAPAATNLSDLTGDYTAQDGDILSGVLGGNYKITIAAGATVTLDGMTINGVNNGSYKWAGLNCEGDATSILADGTDNTVKGFHQGRPGILVPSGKTLTIKGGTAGTGTLTASSNGQAAGIGGGSGPKCGNISIEGGFITATGGDYAAGIGGGEGKSCGNISITGGTVTATGGVYAAGIGGGTNATCGTITIANTVTKVTATKDTSAPCSIGASLGGTCGTITIGGQVYANGVSDSPYTYQPSN